ncbi:MAG: MBL fold metallo-hydrolase [Verrucomicrobiales bacterium]
MKVIAPALLAALLCGCRSYHPLQDPGLRLPLSEPDSAASAEGVEVTFLGNTTLLIKDRETTLLVDGFLSRPGALKTLAGKIGPDWATISSELGKAGVSKVDAVLVGHAHHDHALDATAIADHFGAAVYGSESFGNIYRGSHDPSARGRFVPVPANGGKFSVGRFEVTFAPSDHVGSHSLLQRVVEGSIDQPLSLPAHYSRFKCGDVFALHIAHPDGAIAVTTTAGAKANQLSGLRANVLFLGVGLLAKEPADKQDQYFRETVEATRPDLIVPVHWDNFSRKLTRGLKPSALDDVESAMALVKAKAGERKVRILDLRESVHLRGGRISM